jgi:hypothetical protein|tara:strand:- start:90 stop:365 length:276 start_codon:yes stop_codon:yes gene_type:complete
MTVTIRPINDEHHEYFAFANSLCRQATYFVYFKDSISGAIALHNFMEMVRLFFKHDKLEVKHSEKRLEIKNKLLLEVIRAQIEPCDPPVSA